MRARSSILDAIESATGTRPEGAAVPVSGGCIHQSFQLGDVFIKTNTVDKAPVLHAEATGLRALAATGCLHVPAIVCSGQDHETAFLVLEFLPLVPSTARSQARLGSQLAALHRHHSTSFGFSSDNFIGETPQPNQATANWLTFFREQRLAHLGTLLADSGKPVAGLDALLESLEVYFDDYAPASSLLHGDLWAGNAGALADETPVVFDPAVSYGDREADLAMTELFGGFAREFYLAYQEAWPLHPGYAERKHLYNLYHVLNHAHLFGGGYHSQAEEMVQSLLARADSP